MLLATVVETSTQVAATPKRLAKIQVLADLLKLLDGGDTNAFDNAVKKYMGIPV